MRHTIYIEETTIDDDGNQRGYRSHLITLSNHDALVRILGYIINLEWLDDLVKPGDVLVYDEELDG